MSPDNYAGMGAAINGDVNGDGFDDLMLDIRGSVEEMGTTYSSVVLFYMPLQGIHTILENDWLIATNGNNTIGSIDGDFNGDGLDDLVINNDAGLLNSRGSKGIFYAPLMPGPQSYLEADAILSSIDGSLLQQSFSGGDLDRDGFDDLAIRTEGADQLSRAYVLQGGPVELDR